MEAPLTSNSVSFVRTGGQVALRHRLRSAPQGGDLRWSLESSKSQQSAILLTHRVSEYLTGELPNGMDDNGCAARIL